MSIKKYDALLEGLVINLEKKEILFNLDRLNNQFKLITALDKINKVFKENDIPEININELIRLSLGRENQYEYFLSLIKLKFENLGFKLEIK